MFNKFINDGAASETDVIEQAHADTGAPKSAISVYTFYKDFVFIFVGKTEYSYRLTKTGKIKKDSLRKG